MKNYEVMTEDMNPCGGPDRARKEFIDVQCDDPVAWVRENGRYPITEISDTAEGLIITTGDTLGLAMRYTFTEY